MGFIKNILVGGVIGIANIIPGVSGGTMAVILNIYDKLIDAISHFFENIKKNLLFLIPVVLGAGIGILAFSKLLEFLLTQYPMATNYLFIGLILGSIPMIYKSATKEKFKPTSIIPFIIACLIMIATVFFSEGNKAMMNVSFSWPLAAQLFICTIIASAAMVLPGISGSMVMVILGCYNIVLTAISHLNIPVLIPVACGAAVGIILAAKGIDYCLSKFPQATYFAILGLILGSLVPMVIRAGYSGIMQTVVSMVTLGIGVGLALLFASDSFKNFVGDNSVSH